MAKLKQHIKSTDSVLGMLNDILTGSTSDKILRSGFSVLIYQNSILIRQNELIIRALEGDLEEG